MRVHVCSCRGCAWVCVYCRIMHSVGLLWNTCCQNRILFFCLSAFLRISPCYLTHSLSLSLSARLSVCLSVCLSVSVCRSVLQVSTAFAPAPWHLFRRPGCPPLPAWAAVFSANAVGTRPPVTLRHPYAR